MTDDLKAWLKLYCPELNAGQITMLHNKIKALKVEEVDRFADHLSDLDEEAAFEYGWNSYAYQRIRFIDAEGDNNATVS